MKPTTTAAAASPKNQLWRSLGVSGVVQLSDRELAQLMGL